MERGDFASGAAPLLFRVHGGMPYGEVKPTRIVPTQSRWGANGLLRFRV